MSIGSTPGPSWRARVAGLAGTIILGSSAFAADYVDLRDIVPVRDGDTVAGKEKATACLACHGANGMAPVPTFPNLRGMTAEYLYWQLVDYKAGVVTQPVMTAIAASLEDQDLRDLAAYYAGAHNRPLAAGTGPAGTVDGESVLQGQRLYLDGDAGRGIPPCQGCHGGDARGHPLATAPTAAVAYRTYPPLRGQNAAYLVTRLAEYRDGRFGNSTNDFIMTGAARHLDDASIEAIAAWLSTRSVD